MCVCVCVCVYIYVCIYVCVYKILKLNFIFSLSFFIAARTALSLHITVAKMKKSQGGLFYNLL